MKSGFTLIELLVVMAIILILTAIAVPNFQQFRKKAYDTQALSDLRSLALAEESYFLDNESYASCSNNSCAGLPGIKKISPGVEISASGNTENYSITARHSKGTGKVYSWDSNQGGLLN